MSDHELLLIGYVVKTHGVRGQLRISLEHNIKELFPGEALFLLQRGEKVPFFISEIEYLGNGDILVRFEEILTPEEGSRYTKKPVWGNPDMIDESIPSEEDDDLKGFRLFDSELGAIGIIEKVYHMGDYQLLELDYKGKEVLIPLHTDFLQSIDTVKKQLSVRLPDGLLDI